MTKGPNKIVPASEILDKILHGEDVEYEFVVVEGDLDLSRLDLPTQHVERSELEKELYGLEEEVKVIKSKFYITNSYMKETLNFGNVVFQKSIAFSDTEFRCDTDFTGTKFGGNANFTGAKFFNKAYFNSAQFIEGNVDFKGTQFGDNASFRGAKFTNEANFNSAQFIEGNVDFRDTQFGDNANFSGAKFTNKTYFNSIQFMKKADFNSAKFGDRAHLEDVVYLGEAQFTNKADFSNTHFEDDAFFSNAQFTGVDAFFSNVLFAGDNADFNSVLFNEGDAYFISAKFMGGEANFKETQFGRDAYFGGAQFTKKANFKNAQFTGGEASFKSAQFAKKADFSNAQFTKKADFNNNQFGGDANFNDVLFAGADANFSGAQFAKKADFKAATFDVKDISFKDTTFSRPQDQEYPCRCAKRIKEGLGDKQSADDYFYREMVGRRTRLQDEIPVILRIPSPFPMDYESAMWFPSRPFGSTQGYEDLPIQLDTPFLKAASKFYNFIKHGFLEYVFIQLIFGYGVRPFRLAGIWIIAVVAFGIFYWNFQVIENKYPADSMAGSYLVQCIYFSIVTAATPGYGNYDLVSWRYQIAAGAEAIFGTFMWAAFITTFARKYMR